MIESKGDICNVEMIGIHSRFVRRFMSMLFASLTVNFAIKRDRFVIYSRVSHVVFAVQLAEPTAVP